MKSDRSELVLLVRVFTKTVASAVLFSICELGMPRKFALGAKPLVPLKPPCFAVFPILLSVSDSLLPAKHDQVSGASSTDLTETIALSRFVSVLSSFTDCFRPTEPDTKSLNLG